MLWGERYQTSSRLHLNPFLRLGKGSRNTSGPTPTTGWKIGSCFRISLRGSHPCLRGTSRPLLEERSSPWPWIMLWHYSEDGRQPELGRGMQNTKRHAYREGDGSACRKNRPTNEEIWWTGHWSYHCHYPSHRLTHDVWGMWECWPHGDQLPGNPGGRIVHQQWVPPTIAR